MKLTTKTLVTVALLLGVINTSCTNKISKVQEPFSTIQHHQNGTTTSTAKKETDRINNNYFRNNSTSLSQKSNPDNFIKSNFKQHYYDYQSEFSSSNKKNQIVIQIVICLMILFSTSKIYVQNIDNDGVWLDSELQRIRRKTKR